MAVIWKWHSFVVFKLEAGLKLVVGRIVTAWDETREPLAGVFLCKFGKACCAYLELKAGVGVHSGYPFIFVEKFCIEMSDVFWVKYCKLL